MNGVIEIFRGMGRNFKVFAGMLFIYLKVTSNKSAPEVSIVHLSWHVITVRYLQYFLRHTALTKQ